MEDALGKLQSFLDDAALAVQPIEEDPVKKKKLLKQCASHSNIGHVMSHEGVHAMRFTTGVDRECRHVQAEEGQREAP